MKYTEVIYTFICTCSFNEHITLWCNMSGIISSIHCNIPLISSIIQIHCNQSNMASALIKVNISHKKPQTKWPLSNSLWLQVRLEGRGRSLCNQRQSPLIVMEDSGGTALRHDDVIKWKYFPCYWPFVRGIHRSPVNSPHKGQWRGALVFSLICVWINGWVNTREAGDLRRYRAHYDVSVMAHCPQMGYMGMHSREQAF